MAKTDVANRLIWFKGQIMNVNDAMVNVLSPTSQFGLNVFEGIPCYWNDEQKQLYAFRLSDHYDRLIRSAKLIQLDSKFTKEDYKKALVDTVKANEYDENLSVRQTLFVDGFGSWGSEGPVEMFVAPIPRGRTAAEYNKKGLNCCITSWRRISDENLSPRIKCGANYINSRVGQREALRNGFDTCIFLNEVGKIAEGPGSCFFMVKGDTLITPRLTDSVLESITRDTVIRLATEELGMKFVERTIDRYRRAASCSRQDSRTESALCHLHRRDVDGCLEAQWFAQSLDYECYECPSSWSERGASSHHFILPRQAVERASRPHRKGR